MFRVCPHGREKKELQVTSVHISKLDKAESKIFKSKVPTKGGGTELATGTQAGPL